jgi:acetate kinase
MSHSGQIVVLNSGSSSLKVAAYAADTAKLLTLATVDSIGPDARLKMGTIDKPIAATDPTSAMKGLATVPYGPFSGNIVGFGHRIVHGGPDLDRPVLINQETLSQLSSLSSLAPLHNPPALAVIHALGEQFPNIPQIACFDTAFHRGHPAIADRFALPESLYREGVRRYGFHGLSYQYIAGVLPPDIASGRVIVAHLGSGASMCAIVNRRSVDSSMGFSALDGLPMGTRSGSLDAGVILWLQQQKGWSAAQVETFLYHSCGLKGLSGISNDIRVLLASDSPAAKMAVEYFVYHVARTAGALTISMGGIDGLVFTAGIGEHSVPIRERVLARLDCLGFTANPQANASGARKITQNASKPAYVIPTNEELVIAQATLALLKLQS